MQTCNRYRYFEDTRQARNSAGQEELGSDGLDQRDQSDGLDISEKTNVFNRLLSFFKDLIGKAEEYQDELHLSCIDLLLQVPLALLYNKDTGTDNVELWKGVMLKALEQGHTDNSIAMTCVKMLEQWFSRLPPTTTVKLY